MKKILSNVFTVSLLIINTTFLVAQVNLVPNPSFEIYTSCPSSLDQINKCQDWSSFRESPDYFNICSSYSGTTPPYCFAGFQQPQSGNAFAGLITYENFGAGPNYREILGAKLNSTMNIGTKYYFSFFVNYGGGQAFEIATNKIGLRFSTVPASKTNPFPINNYAHYYCTTKITDSLNWSKIKGYFLADSVYDYIAIGNFFNDSNTDTLSTGPYNHTSYYYIDNVCLSTDSNFAFNVFVNEFDKFNNIFVYPNPSSGVINIKCNDTPDEIEIFDLIGKSQIKFDYFERLNKRIDVSFLTNGFYLLKIKIQDQIVQKQLVIYK